MDGMGLEGIVIELVNGKFEISCPTIVSLEDIEDIETLAQMFVERLRRQHERIPEVVPTNNGEVLEEEIPETKSMQERSLESKKQAVSFIYEKGPISRNTLGKLIDRHGSWIHRMVTDHPWFYLDKRTNLVHITAVAKREVLNMNMEESTQLEVKDENEAKESPK